MAGHDDPRDCGLALAIPFTREAFMANYRDPSRSFIRGWAAGYPGRPIDLLWNDYRSIAAYAWTAIAEAQAAGVLVAGDASFDAWMSVVRARRVTTLVAHWADGAGGGVEYADGVAPLGRLCEALPGEFDGVLDMTLCHSAQAIAPIKRARPRCTVLANRRAARLDLRLVMYRQVIRILAHEPTTYVDAAMRAHMALLEVT